MPLKITRRKDRPGLRIAGYIQLPDGSRVRVRTRAQSDRPELAREQAAALEAQILRDAWLGRRPAARSFAEAVESYLKAEPRARGDQQRLRRILLALGDVSVADLGQERLQQLQGKLLAPEASPATIRRGVIAPIRAVLNHAAALGWCAPPKFRIPRQPAGRTLYLLPAEAERLLAATAPHLAPLFLLLLDTGARLSEALELDWREVDLGGARVIFWRTKSGRRRDAPLSPRTVAALAGLPEREGAVFRWPDRSGRRRRPYADRGRQGGGQIKRGWSTAIRRAGLPAELTPHDLRHSWASWHYARHRDLLLLKQAGAWSSVALVERYAHLLPAGQAEAIAEFWSSPAMLPAAMGESA
jgi:integrase